MRIFFVLWILFWAPSALGAPAQAGSWQMNCQTTVSGSTPTSGGTLYCYTPATGADDEVATPILDVVQCENVDVFLFDDYDGDATACTVTWDVENCPPRAASLSTDTLKNAACNDAPGVTDLSGDDVESNLALTHVRFVGNNAGANITSCQIVVKCAEDGRK